MKKQEDYFIGLDIGTNSVGWAVTTPEYNLKKYNNKFMQGIRRFDAMETAEQRRNFRSARRRLNRRKDRLDQLQNYFRNEIDKIDPDFFIRLDEGFLQTEEQTVKRHHTLFDEQEFNDKDYYVKYPTIYHLRNHLMLSNEKEDIRLVYLATHHIMKYRGHFLFSGELNLDDNVLELLEKLNIISYNIFEKEVFDFSTKKKINKFLDVLTNQKINKTNKSKLFKECFNKDINKEEKHFEEIHKLLSARKTNIENLFINIEFEEKVVLQLDSNNIEEDLMKLTMLDDESILLIETIKAIYDWGILQNTLKGEKSISVSMIKSYDKHKEELMILKKIIKDIDSNLYSDFFHNVENKNSYAYYVENGVASREVMYKEIRKHLKKASSKFDLEVKEIELSMENNMYLLKQRIPTNGVIPNQVHLYELDTILANASNHYEFLNETDDIGLSISEQIKEIFKFRIPYYIGPLNDYHKDTGFAWVVRKEKGKVYPWNFEEKIDVQETAKEFIMRMTNKCSYLFNEDVLPKNSLLYEKFMVLNEINNIKINGENISVEMKKHLYNDLFYKTNRSVSKNTISNWVKSNYPEYLNITIDITGIENNVKSRLNSLHSFLKIFGDKLPNFDILENIIFWNTVFDEDSYMLRNNIKNNYPNMFTEKEITQIEKLTFTGWGRISRKMLEGLLDNNIAKEPLSIIQSLYETNNNIMELLSTKYTYQTQINDLNKEIDIQKEFGYEILDKLNLPPNIKRSVWQTIRITEEIKKVLKNDPSKIFIEMPRGNINNQGRIDSRKTQLLAFYKSFNKDDSLIQSLTENLKKEEDSNLRRKKIYLYYRQMGRCMYTGETIYFKDLLKEGKDAMYDIDHIYPRSLTSDDSMKNLALVTKRANQLKSDTYPLNKVNLKWQDNMTPFWNALLKANLLEKETYYRLTRKTDLTEEELSGFIARQLVETGQSTKAVFHLMKQLYPESKVVSVKAQHIDRFRHDNELIKVRSLNDLHHAKDAYLSIVVGNVYYERFTNDPRNFVKLARKRSYNLTKLFDTESNNKDVFSERTGEVVWVSGPDGTIKKVERNFYNNSVLSTYMIQDKAGKLFDQLILSREKAKGKKKPPIKRGLSPEVYGGYNGASYSFYALFDRKMGRKIIRCLEPVQLYLQNTIKNESDLKEYFEKFYNYEDVKIINKHIPSTNILLEFDGGRQRITGVSDYRSTLRNEVQPFFNKEFTVIWKKIERIKTHDHLYLINNISEMELNYVLDAILEKMIMPTNKNRLEKIYNKIIDKKKVINELTKEEYINLLWEMISLIKSVRETSDLSLIGESKTSGLNRINRNLSTKKEIYLIHQSVTGLYERKENLLE